MSTIRPHATLLTSLIYATIFFPTAVSAQLPFDSAMRSAAARNDVRQSAGSQAHTTCQQYNRLRGLYERIARHASSSNDLLSFGELSDGPRFANSLEQSTSPQASGCSVGGEQTNEWLALLETALTYLDLTRLELEVPVVRHQHRTALRLIDVETERVKAGIDNSTTLNLARLREARVRMKLVDAEGATAELRTNLADLTGLPEQKLIPMVESIPSAIDVGAYVESMKESETRTLATSTSAGPNRAGTPARMSHIVTMLLAAFNPEGSPATNVSMKSEVAPFAMNLASLRTIVRWLAAARDATQLEYVLARAASDKLAVTGELKGMPIGDQITAELLEREKFGKLIDYVYDLTIAQNLLHALESIQIKHIHQVAIDEMPAPPEGVEGRSMHALLIAPPLYSLSAEDSKRLFAVAAYRQADARDVSAIAIWTSSNDLLAIVSTSGLVTALSPGQVTITAHFDGWSQPRQLNVQGRDLSGKASQ